jgi:hypothetical protein
VSELSKKIAREMFAEPDTTSKRLAAERFAKVGTAAELMPQVPLPVRELPEEREPTFREKALAQFRAGETPFKKDPSLLERVGAMIGAPSFAAPPREGPIAEGLRTPAIKFSKLLKKDPTDQDVQGSFDDTPVFKKLPLNRKKELYGLGQSVLELAEGFTAPETFALIGGLSVVKGGIGRLFSAIFSADMLSQEPEIVAEFVDAIKGKDRVRAAKAIGLAAGTAGFGIAAAKHAIGKTPPKPPASRPLKEFNKALAKERIAVRVVGARGREFRSEVQRQTLIKRLAAEEFKKAKVAIEEIEKVEVPEKKLAEIKPEVKKPKVTTVIEVKPSALKVTETTKDVTEKFIRESGGIEKASLRAQKRIDKIEDELVKKYGTKTVVEAPIFGEVFQFAGEEVRIKKETPLSETELKRLREATEFRNRIDKKLDLSRLELAKSRITVKTPASEKAVNEALKSIQTTGGGPTFIEQRQKGIPITKEEMGDFLNTTYKILAADVKFKGNREFPLNIGTSIKSDLADLKSGALSVNATSGIERLLKQTKDIVESALGVNIPKETLQLPEAKKARPEVIVSKKPHEMTIREIVDQISERKIKPEQITQKQYIEAQQLFKRERDITQENVKELKKRHQKLIEIALDRGVVIKDEVLKDYPELQRQVRIEVKRKAEEFKTKEADLGETFGKTNKVFTKKAKDKAIQNAIERLKRTPAGFDPAAFKDIITVGGYYFEGGLKAFPKWSARMIKQFGEKIKPHLKNIWNEIQKRPITRKKAIGETKIEKFPEEAHPVIKNTVRQFGEELREQRRGERPISLTVKQAKRQKPLI